MSDQYIIKWLNDTKLSKQISTIEFDFANGKLFAELLAKHNQNIDISALSNKESLPERLNNLRLIEPHLKALGVRLEPLTLDKIIKEEKGAALKILSQLKVIFNDKTKLGKVASSRSPEGFNMALTSKQTQNILPGTAPMGSQRYNKTQTLDPLRQTARTKYTDIETRLERFENTRVVNEERALKEIQKIEARYQEVKAEVRVKHLETLRENKQYLKDIEAKGWEDWKKNNQVKETRLIKEKAFEDRMTQGMKKKYLEKEEIERLDAMEGMKEFEINAQKIGVDLEHDPEEVKLIEKGGISENALKMKLKEKAQQSELARKERDKRVRKMKVDQEKAQVEIEARKAEELLVDKLMARSKKENEVCYNKWRAEQMEKVLTKTRKTKEEGYREKKKQEIDKMQAEKDNRSSNISDEDRRKARLKKMSQRETNLNLLVEKRKKHSNLCSHLFNQIMEVAEMCFQQQQSSDNIQIDARFWRNACELFVDDEIVFSKKKLRHEALENMNRNTEEDQELERYILSEFDSYLNGRESWRPFHQSRPIGAVSLNEYIPDQPLNNDKLGVIIQNVIDATYPPIPVQKPSSDIPNHLPLRLLSTGYPFSGRKTVSAFLKQKYGIEVLKMEDIVKEALDLNAPPPPEDPKKAKKAPKGKEPEPPKIENEELKRLGLIIKELQEKREAIPIEVYIDVFKAKLKEFFPPITQEQLVEEIKLYKRKEDERIIEIQKQQEIEAKKKKPPTKKDPAAPPEGEALPPIPRRPYYTKGWILLDFPGNLQEAKLFEQTLSGYVPEEERLNLQAEDKKQRAGILVKAPVKPPEKTQFIEGGLDCAIKLEVTPEESLKRALGRRVDPKTGNIYHLEYNPPPANDKALNERLVPINDPENTEGKIREKLERYDDNKEELEGWLSMFGIEDLQVDCLQNFDGVGKIEEVQARMDEHINKILEYKIKEKYEKILEQDEARKLNEQQQQQQQQAKSQAIIPEEEKVNKENVVGSQIEAVPAEEEKENPMMKSQKSSLVEGAFVPTNRTEFDAKKHMADLSALWETTEESYLAAVREFFNNIAAQRSFVATRFAEIQTRFLEVLQKQGDKLKILRKFHEKFNRFIEDNPDILEDTETRDELNHRLEELQDKLWHIIETKKDKAVAERKAIIESDYIEKEMEFFIINIQKLIQAELDRHFNCIKLIGNYYMSLQGRAPTDAQLPVPSGFELLPSPEHCPPIQNLLEPDSFPRLELLYQNTLQILNGDESPPSTQRKTASANNRRSAPSSQGYTRKRLESIYSDKKGDSPFDKEAEEAIATENSIIRYRVFILYTIAVTKIKEMRMMAKALYNKLDDWIIYGIKAENDALYEQSKSIKKAIEKPERLQRELNAGYPDVTINHKIINYSELLPVVLPQGETVTSNRFTLSNLMAFIEELGFLMDDDATIKTIALSQFFTRRLVSALSKGDFPADWISYGPKLGLKFLENLDLDSSGFISWKALCSHLCLLDAPIPTRNELNEYANNLLAQSEEGWITREAFTNCPAFFDKTDIVARNLKGQPVFSRVTLLKEILFYVNRDIEHDLLDVNDYINNISKIKELVPEPESVAMEGSRSKKKENRGLVLPSRTYIEVLFSETK